MADQLGEQDAEGATRHLMDPSVFAVLWGLTTMLMAGHLLATQAWGYPMFGPLYWVAFVALLATVGAQLADSAYRKWWV